MHPRIDRLHAALTLLFVAACDPGGSIHVTVEVPAEIAAAYTGGGRGLLLVNIDSDGFGPTLRAVGVVCGAAVTWETGDAHTGGQPDAVVTAWIEPLPAENTLPCGLLPADVAEEFIEGATPAATDPQASIDAEAPRGCDSHAFDVELTLATPDA